MPILLTFLYFIYTAGLGAVASEIKSSIPIVIVFLTLIGTIFAYVIYTALLFPGVITAIAAGLLGVVGFIVGLTISNSTNKN